MRIKFAMPDIDLSAIVLIGDVCEITFPDDEPRVGRVVELDRGKESLTIEFEE